MYPFTVTSTYSTLSQRVHWRAALPLGLAWLAGCGADSSSEELTTVGLLVDETPYASWTASPQNALEPIPFPGAPAPELRQLASQTLRQVVRLSAGGEKLRVRLSNTYGPAPIRFDQAGVALSLGESEIDETTHQPLTFDGQPSVTIAVGQEVWSDYVALATDDHATLAVSLYSEEASGLGTTHSLGRQTAFLTEGATVTDSRLNALPVELTSYFCLTAVEVAGQAERRVVVAFGDSITDGFNSTVNENRRYPNYLSERLLGAGGDSLYSIVNAGISGNRVLTDGIGPAATSRFAHDVLDVASVDDVVILLGINDIGIGGFLEEQAVTSVEITDGLERLVGLAVDRGLEVYLGTLLPFQGTFEPYYREQAEAMRQEVNDWIRSNQGVAGVIDFDQLMADPLNPLTMLPLYNSGDFLHPNDSGYEAMAREVATALLP